MEELLAERGVTVDHVTVYRWVRTFTSEFIDVARPLRHVPGDRWFVDETYVKVAGAWTYLHRTVDQHGQVVDVPLSTRRNLDAARAFFARAAGAVPAPVPVEVTTDRAAATRGCWTSCCLEHVTTPSGTPTIELSAIMAGSRPGCDRCVA